MTSKTAHGRKYLHRIWDNEREAISESLRWEREPEAPTTTPAESDEHGMEGSRVMMDSSRSIEALARDSTLSRRCRVCIIAVSSTSIFLSMVETRASTGALCTACASVTFMELRADCNANRSEEPIADNWLPQCVSMRCGTGIAIWTHVSPQNAQLAHSARVTICSWKAWQKAQGEGGGRSGELL